MAEQIFASIVSTFFGALIGMWVYGQLLRSMLEKYDARLVEGRLTFIPHSPTPQEDDTQCET